LEHSYVNERGLVASIEDNQQSQFRTLGSPLKLSLCPVSYRLPPPGFGEHTLQILESLDYSAAEIDRLFEHKVVHQSKMTRGKP
ncbi:MAG: hypothetical protein NTX25_20100, partial [Proteobacteria bacterium]|nr:hypothetical protein [Pseudomonadota bacterium]